MTEFAARKNKNESGIMENSILTVRVIQATDLIPMDNGGISDPYCILEVEDNIIETSVKHKTLNPRWDESFTFPIKTGNEILHVTVLDQDRGKDDDFEGKIQIKVRELNDQKSVDHWFDLKPMDGSDKWRGRLNLNLQWVHSKIDMLKTLITEKIQEMEILEENIEYYDQRYKVCENIITGKSFSTSGFFSATPQSANRTSFNETSKFEKSSQKMDEFDHLTLAKLAGRVMDREHKWALAMENTSNKLSHRLGFNQTPWFLLFQVFTGVFLVSILL